MQPAQRRTRLARQLARRSRAQGPIAALPAQRKWGGVKAGAASSAGAPDASTTCANAATGESPSANTVDRRTFAVLRKPGDCLFMSHLFQKTSLIPHHAVYRPTLSHFGCSRKIGTRVQPEPPILSRMSHLVDKLPHLLSTIRVRIHGSRLPLAGTNGPVEPFAPTAPSQLPRFVKPSAILSENRRRCAKYSCLGQIRTRLQLA